MKTVFDLRGSKTSQNLELISEKIQDVNIWQIYNIIALKLSNSIKLILFIVWSLKNLIDRQRMF